MTAGQDSPQPLEPAGGKRAAHVVRMAAYGSFFATRQKMREIISERLDGLQGQPLILDWEGVEAVSGAFASEYVAWFLLTPDVHVRWMNAEVRETCELARRRLTEPRAASGEAAKTANPNLRTFTVTMNAKTCDGLDYSARDLAVAIIGEHMFADVDVTENEPAASGEQAAAVPESARKLPPGTEGCAWCWLDIVPDGEGGWRLLSDDNENPSHCNSQHCSRSKDGHQPGRWQNGGMVPIAEARAR